MGKIFLGVALGSSITLNCICLLLMEAAGKSWEDKEKEYKNEIKYLRSKLEESHG